MASDSQELTKLYYTIGEVADMFDVNTSLIRYWEKEFKQIKPKKNKKGNRLFRPKDVKTFQVIYHMVKIKGFTLDGAKQQLKEDYKTYSDEAEVIRRLEAMKKLLDQKLQ